MDYTPPPAACPSGRLRRSFRHPASTVPLAREWRLFAWFSRFTERGGGPNAGACQGPSL